MTENSKKLGKKVIIQVFPDEAISFIVSETLAPGVIFEFELLSNSWQFIANHADVASPLRLQ
jgi:hypothetical protein